MKDEEIDALVATIVAATGRGEIDTTMMREGDRAMASLVVDLLKNLNHIAKSLDQIAEAQRIMAATAVAQAASRGLSP